MYHMHEQVTGGRILYSSEKGNCTVRAYSYLI